MAQESEWQLHEPDPRQAGRGFGAGSLCQCICICTADTSGTDALGTNQYLGLWQSCQKPAGSHGCRVTASPLPLVMGWEWLWGILAREATAPVVALTKAFIPVPPERGCGGRRGKENVEQRSSSPRKRAWRGTWGGRWLGAPGTPCTQAGLLREPRGRALRDREGRFDPTPCREGKRESRGSGLCKEVMGGGRWRIKWDRGEWE